MADLVAGLAAKGRALPPEERVRLLDLLLESLHDASSIDAEDAWNKKSSAAWPRMSAAKAVCMK